MATPDPIWPKSRYLLGRQYAPDPIIATILDWLLHHEQIVGVRGDRYRPTAKRRAGCMSTRVR